ncbi:MAG: 4a-hydroxytetrahydrobiopterin dehydratase [Burkholderiales bacterium]
MLNLASRKCENSKALIKLTDEAITTHLAQVPNWQLDPNQSAIISRFEFKNFKQLIFFINAVAFVCDQECHHPEVKFGYNWCEIAFATHDAQGLTSNDFICAAKVNALTQ